MKLSATRVFPLALLLTLTLLSFWLERTVREDSPAPPAGRHDPDYSAEQFTITDFNRAGAPESTLSAAKMVHYADDDSTVLLAPRLVQTRPEQPQLTLSADRGTLSHDGRELFLNDDVVLVREARGDVPEARMLTTYLHLIRPRALALTDREVRIEELGRVLVGQGMEYDNASRRLSLNAQVRGTFEAKQ